MCMIAVRYTATSQLNSVDSLSLLVLNHIDLFRTTRVSNLIKYITYRYSNKNTYVSDCLTEMV